MRKLLSIFLLVLYVSLTVSLVFIAPVIGQAFNGAILQQDLDTSGTGYTVMKVWGTYYEMGYAHGHLLGNQVDEMATSLKNYVGLTYDLLKPQISNTFFPPDMIDEINGIVAGVKEVVPGSAITAEDLMMLNTFADWGYSPACRSHSCWGSYVSSPVKTLSTRRTDYPSSQVSELFDFINIVLCAYEPTDSSKIRWVNLSMPGIIVSATSVNEYGTIVSIHDSPASEGSHATGPNVMTRSVALRFMMNIGNLPADISQQTDFVFNAFQSYVPWTGSFLNYYAPMGNAGVISCSVSQGFYSLRKPKQSYFDGEVIVTSNQYTDGNSAPPDATFFTSYYSGSRPKTLADHWGLLDSVSLLEGAQQLSVEHRNRANMTIWARGRLLGTTATPIIKLEWSELFEASVPPMPPKNLRIGNKKLIGFKKR